MATRSHVDSKRKYSWWWDSHISPKNSKWLQENLTDMDMKVKSMIKLLEEDADSFARRAEMYYKKRPELMKLVEEFYRAYRALAERYDHATGALRHAHKTMAEAFPNHVPFALIDDSPSGSLITDGEPRTPEMPPPIRAFAEPDDLQKDILGQSSHFHSIKKSGTFSEDSDALNGKRGLKQLNEMFTSGESTKQLKVAEGRARHGLNFDEDESKTYTGPTDARKNGNGGRGKDDAYEDMSALQDEVSKLVSENQSLKMQIKSENDHVAKCEDEIHRLQDSISKIEADKEASSLQAQRYAESVSNLELEISHSRENSIKLHSEMANKLSRLETIEGQCLLLEAEKRHLEIQLKNLIEENNAQLQELQLKQIEIDKLKADAYLGARILEDKVSQLLSENQALKVNIESEHDHVAKCENRILSLEQSLSKSEADREDTLLLCQRSLEKISNLEMEVSFFQVDIIRLRDEMAIKQASLKTAEDKCLMLEMEKQALEMEAKKLSKEKNDQQNELQLKQIEIDKLKDDAHQITKNLQDEVSRLLSGNQVLRLQIESEHVHTTKCENEILRLEESLSRSEADKNDAFQQYQMTVEKILKLEMEIASILEDNRKLNTEMDIKLERLECSEQRCLLLQKEKQTLEAEFKSLSQEKDAQQQELQQRQTEVDDLKYSLREEHTKYSQIVVALRSLEQLHSQCLEKLGIRELELESGVENLKDMEVKYHILEENIQCVKDINTSLTKELKLKEEEVTKLNLSLQGQLSSLIQAENALRSVEMLHSQSLEEIEIMTLDVQSKVEMLKEMELQKLHLEKEVQQLNEKNEKLNEQVVFSSLTMKSLQEEISNMKENKMKLENEVEHYVDGNKALQATIHSLQRQITELELKYQYILEQIKSIGLEEESFQASVRKLLDRNLELKDLCKMHEDDNNELMNKLENMEIITQKNTLLETSLADATIELEELRKKVNALEESCDSLNIEIARLISENGSLVAQMESINVTVEKLSESNTFLETSLSDADVELEKLRSELKVLEESSQSLHDEKSNLQFEKIALVSQIQGLVSSLENIKRRHAELEGRHWHLEQDKESISTQVTVLHNLLKMKQHEHEAFALSSNTQLTTLANKMNILHIESQSKDRKLEDLQSVLFNFEIQVFILQRCLLESKTCNQIQLASSRHLEQLLSDIKEENMEQKKSIEYIKHHVEELKKGIQIVYRSPDIYSPCNSSVTESKLGGQDVFSKILEVHNFISDTVEENHVLLLEKIISITLMQQLGSDLRILISEKNAMNLDNAIGRQQLLALKSDKQELLMLNERLWESVHAGQLREDNLKAEMAVVGKQFLDLQDRNEESQAEIRILLEENKSLLNELSSLRGNIQNLEEENIVIFAEVINLSCLSLVLEQFSAERIMDLRICSRDLNSLHGINSVLDNKVKAIAESIVLIESEKMQLKSSAVELEDCQGRLLILENDLNVAKSVYQEVNNKVEQLMHKVEVTEGLLTMKEIKLEEANKKNETTNNENVNLHRELEVVKAELNEVMAVRKELEEKNHFLVDDNLQKDQEIGQVKKTSQMLSEMVQHLKKELIELGTSRQHLASELTYEIKLYEEEASRLWTGINVSTLHVDIFEEKLLDLLGECERLEISAIVQRNTLEEQIGLNSFYTDQLKQKLNYLERESGILGEKLNAYLPLVVSLQNSVASLGKQTLSFIRLQELDGYSGQNASQVRAQHTKIPPQLSADFNAIELDGIQGLKKLLSRVEELQKVLMDCTLMLQVPIPDSKSASPNGLQHERTFCMDELPENKNAISQLEIRSEQDTATEPYNAGIPKGGDGLMMKDIQLDKSSHDIVSSLPKRGGEDAKVDDQMLKLWETAEHDSSNVVLGASSLTTTDDTDYRQIEPVEEEKSQYPSQPVAEKELVVDRLRICKKVDSYQEWNRRIMERLSSDAQRLSVLQDSVQELKAQLEKSENSDSALSVKCEAMKRQLQRAEEAILGLVDVNTNLTKKAENCSPSFGDNPGEDIARRQRRRQVSDHALKGSEKIVRLELEVQKIQYILLKLDEERENRNKAAQATSRIVLRDYLYGAGRRENHRRKRGHFCGCMRPKTSED